MYLLATPILPLSSHQTHINKPESLTMEYYITARLATCKVVDKAGDNGGDRVHKGRKRCTGRGERLMWTSLFFPLGFDEVAHDSGYGRE